MVKEIVKTEPALNRVASLKYKYICIDKSRKYFLCCMIINEGLCKNYIYTNYVLQILSKGYSCKGKWKLVLSR
jgi:hypothetical protein